MWDNELSYDSSMSEYWGQQLLAPDTTINAAPASNLRGSVLQIEFGRQVAAGLTEDRAVVSLHFGVRPGVAGLYSHLDASDAAVVEASFMAQVWTAKLETNISTGWALNAFVWRNFGADFPLGPDGSSKPGPIWRSQPLNDPGTSSVARLPDQDALTTTYRTASRKHWGRNYWGGFVTSTVGGVTHGHASVGIVDDLATVVRAWFNDLWDNARVIEAVIWSARYRGILGINELAVDDVFDIQRRRRPKFASYRKVFTS